MFNYYSIIWIFRIFLRIWIRIFLPTSRIFRFRFENILPNLEYFGSHSKKILTMNKIWIRKIHGLWIRFRVRIRSKKNSFQHWPQSQPPLWSVDPPALAGRCCAGAEIPTKHPPLPLLDHARFVDNTRRWIPKKNANLEYHAKNKQVCLTLGWSSVVVCLMFAYRKICCKT